MSSLNALRRHLKRVSRPARAKTNAGFFKTGKGEYGEGDVFCGVTMPDIRKIAKQYSGLSLTDLRRLLASKIHEERLLALIILVQRFQTDLNRQSVIYRFYLSQTRRINNWDLVDASAPRIVGEYLNARQRGVLTRLAKSKILWERRIAIVSTFRFIQEGDLRDTFRIAESLLHDPHDLIHKASGWMLREAGKKDVLALRAFLDRHAACMPRTMLRYAVERLPERERKAVLHRSAHSRRAPKRGAPR